MWGVVKNINMNVVGRRMGSWETIGCVWDLISMFAWGLVGVCAFFVGATIQDLGFG